MEVLPSTPATPTLGRRQELIHPDGGRTTYTCNGAGQVTNLINPLLERTTSVYDAAGNEIQQLLANSTATTTIYDAAGRTTRVAQVGPDGFVVDRFHYTYDAAGRRTNVRELSGDRVTWSYDPTGQLLEEAHSGANAYRTTYVYDPSGNRIVEISDTDRTTSVYDGANRLLWSDSLSGITTYSYDPAGNRTRIETPMFELTTYTWNAENQLVQIEQPDGDIVTHVWSPVNKDAEERIVQHDDGLVTHYLWDNNNILQEISDSGEVTADYTYQPEPYGDLVSYSSYQDDSFFYGFDALGSTTRLTDQTGTATAEYRYSAFGQPVETTGSHTNPYGWVGKVGYRHQAAISLYNLRARDYDPVTNRFLSVDPLGLASGDANFYRYVANQPTNIIDPSGMAPPHGPIVVGGDIAFDPSMPMNDDVVEQANKLQPPRTDLSQVPKERFTRLTHLRRFEHPSTGASVLVTPFIYDGQLVKAVFVENTKTIRTYIDCGGGIPTPHEKIISHGTYRLVGFGSIGYRSDLLAEVLVFDKEEVPAAIQWAELLTTVLHTVPFGTAADACANGNGSVTEVLLATAGDLALGAGLVAKTTVKGGRLLMSANASIWVARGAVALDAAANVGQAGVAVAAIGNDPTLDALAFAAGMATFAIFGLAYERKFYNHGGGGGGGGATPPNNVPLTTITDLAAGSTVHIEIINGIAQVEIGYIHKFTKGFVDAIRDYASKNCAKLLIVDTGPVVNTDLAIKLGLIAKSGERFFGGTVKLISGGKAPIFEITIPID